MPWFLPILSGIKTPTYKLIKFCGQVLKPFTDNKCTIKDSSSFAIEDLEFNDSLFMASFNTREPFTHIPPTETLNVCVLNLYRNQTHAHKLTKSSFYNLLKITMFESFFTFDRKSYEQWDSVGVGFTLGPILADVFICHFKSIWLENCPSHFKPIIYRRFTDDILSLFWTKDHFEKFKKSQQTS